MHPRASELLGTLNMRPHPEGGHYVELHRSAQRIEVPERNLAMTWVLRRNTDKVLPATHIVEIMFKLPADFPPGGILNVPGILMKQADVACRWPGSR